MNISNQEVKSFGTEFDSIIKTKNKYSSGILTPTNIHLNQKASTNSLFLIDKKNKNENNIRQDIYGETIKKRGKHKVSFADNPILLDNEEDKENETLRKEKLVEILNVESYKEYNKLMAFTDYKDEKYILSTESICCESCLII